MSNAPVIEIDHLTKYYGKREIIRDFTLKVPKGSIYGFLGRNGMGKTTTIRILLGMEEPTRGRTFVFGEDSRKLTAATRARIGYLPESHPVYGWMTVAECAKFQAGFYENWKQEIFEAVITHFRLSSKMKAGSLSRGQRAGLCLAMTLAPDPELLVLDDPALGLDPVARRSLLQSLLFVARKADRTILFSSHLLADVERVADRIAILEGGCLRADCSIETFRQQVRQFVLKFRGAPPEAPRIPGLLQSFRADRVLTLTVANAPDELEEHLEALNPLSIEPTELSLEDAFISYVGERGEKTFFINGEAK